MNSNLVVDKIKVACSIIQVAGTKELNRQTNSRKKTLESTYSTLDTNCSKLGIFLDPLSTFYSPTQYLERANQAMTEIAARPRPL